MTKYYFSRFLWCLFLLTASTIAPIHAQNSSIVWNRTIENYLDEVKMATTSDGSVGLIVTGTRPGRPIELTKLDPSGNIAWQRPILGTRINIQNGSVPFINLEVTHLYLIESTRDGGFVVVVQQRVTSSLLYMITKFDSSGNQLWIEAIDENPPGATSSLLPISLSQTSDGGFIVGMGVSQTRFGPFVQLYKRNSLGREEWKRSYSSTTSLSNSRFASLIFNALTDNSPVVFG